MLNKIGLLFRPVLSSFASLSFDALHRGYVLMPRMGEVNVLFSEQAPSKLYRECLYSHPVIPEALYFQITWYLEIEQLFFTAHFTIQLQVCLASALFLTIKLHCGPQIPL